MQGNWDYEIIGLPFQGCKARKCRWCCTEQVDNLGYENCTSRLSYLYVYALPALYTLTALLVRQNLKPKNFNIFGYSEATKILWDFD